MNTKGIRISDGDTFVSVQLSDILEEIPNGNAFKWSILFLWAMGNLGQGKSMPEFENQISEFEKGFFISWEDLNDLAEKFEQVIEMIVIGSRDQNRLRRYENDQDMYESCDIVIEMIDSCFWQVFSYDEKLIDRLAAKFNEIELLEPDFLK